MEVTVYKEYKTLLDRADFTGFIIGLENYLNEHVGKYDLVEIAKTSGSTKEIYNLKIKTINTYKVDTDADVEDYFEHDNFDIWCNIPWIPVRITCNCTKLKVFIMD